LMSYLEKQKEEVSGTCLSMANATYEFFLENPDDRVIFQWQFDGCSEMIREILEYGQEKGEFEIEDLAAFARHVALFLNSMHLSAPILNFPQPRIEEQFKMILNTIL
ncbi:MAG: TetR/AcrR family transcriptional regulator, partial [Eubacterium sp.]